MHFKEVILRTSSIAKTKLFYNKTLELPVVNERDDMVSFQAGKTIIIFEADTEDKPFYHIAFNVTNNKFSDSFEWINRKLDIIPASEELPIALYPNWNAQSFYFYDNNGSILEFIVRFDLPYESKEPFSVADIKEVSEVGIVVPDVPKAIEQLQTAYHIPGFKYGPKLQDFAVLGNNYGLLILAQIGRHWMPTHKGAKQFPVRIVADDMTLEL